MSGEGRAEMSRTDRLDILKEKGISELKRFLIIFLYLWVIFGLFSLNRAIIENDLGYLTQGFALINAAVFGKVMLVAEDLKIGSRFQSRPLIYPVVYRATLFSVLLLLFHILEEMFVTLWKGGGVTHGFPALGGSAFLGALCVWGSLSIALAPFFALRGVSEMMGGHQLWNLFFHRQPTPLSTP